jgi:hypothetical protein
VKLANVYHLIIHKDFKITRSCPILSIIVTLVSVVPNFSVHSLAKMISQQHCFLKIIFFFLKKKKWKTVEDHSSVHVYRKVVN